MAVSNQTIRRHAKDAGLPVWRAFCRRRDELKRRLGDDKAALQEAWLQAYREIVEPAMREQELGEEGAAQLSRLKDWLVSKSVFEGKADVDILTEIEWVRNHIPIADVQARDAPSPGAWAMLYYVRSDPDGARQFWTQINTKLIPSRSQLQKDAAFKDDGRDVDEMLLAELRRAAGDDRAA